jgi:HD-GYP domain-containing protein (c-di-GMP phosphodiesterase class II)
MPMARLSLDSLGSWVLGAWKGRRPRSFQVTLVLLILPLILGSGFLRSLIFADHSKRMLIRANGQLLEATADEIVASMGLALNPALTKAQLDRVASLAPAGDIAAAIDQLPALLETLEQAPNLTALFIANGLGEMLLVTREPAAGTGQAGGVPEARWSVASLRQQAGKLQAREWQLGRDQRPLAPSQRKPLLTLDFDPRLGPWFQGARREGHLVMVPVSRLRFGGRPALTLSQPLAQGKGVVGAAIDPANLAGVLARHRLPAASVLAISDRQGQVLATSPNLTSPGAGSQQLPQPAQGANPALAQLAADLPRKASQGFHQGQFGGQNWFQKVVPLQSPLTNQPLYLAVAVPEAGMMAEARQQLWKVILATLLLVLFTIWLLVKFAGILSQDLKRLTQEAAAIRGFQFETGPRLHSMVREVDDLSLTLDGMRRTIGHFLEISASLGAERNVDDLLSCLLKESIGASAASAGALYLAQAPGQAPSPAPVRFLPTLVMAGEHQGDSQALEPLDEADLASMLQRGRFDQLVGALGPEARACIPLPLRQRDGSVLGVLVLWFQSEPDTNQIAFSKALSGNAEVALQTRQLIEDQKHLFEAFIQVIADAIDAKSPYTGGHCARVPEIAKLLAAAACGAEEGPFAQYQLNADQWEALHVAAWLHDCGKVTTPDHVVDKATKLETVHDRIHEIRMRFELLKSEAETAHWRRIASGADPKTSQQSLDASWSRLDDDFAFVAACNLGGERMAPEQIGRLRAIASRTWRRSLDDRLGVGPEELRRRQRQPAPALPVQEPLLADRADHLIERPERDRIAPDNPWGFAMEVPDYLYNLGELHNLTVERGTLSPEDRFKINEHMVQTIRMLSALPFPRHLAAVPEIAGAHHETLDGRGYPRRLHGGQMGVLARVMAIADIFEALTAADRPYKRGLKLSEALAIMARMVQDQHIDADLFDLFLSSEVYLSYAQRHMEPAQIDGVDREALLAIAQASAA